MKLKLFCLVLLLGTTTWLSAQTLTLYRTINQTHADEYPAIVNADSYGGAMSFNRNYAPGCQGSYEIQWRFSKNIATLNDGDTFSVEIECTNCSTPCGYRKTSATASGANNITGGVPGIPDYQYNGNITSTGSTGSVHVWYDGHKKHTTTFKVAIKKTTPYTGFYISMGSHTVSYIYTSAPVATGEINCHTLFGLGKLVSNLELGAWNGYGWDWMVETIDFALDHIEASNCLSSDYLVGLKSRITGAADTRSFYEEIQSYSLALNGEVETSCACCNTCRN
jgi:hypothetical protein